MLVRSAHAYAEDHLEFLREDADCMPPRSVLGALFLFSNYG